MPDLPVGAGFEAVLAVRLDGDGPLGVAVSGGGDSLALLYRLARWGRRPLHVFCVDHGLNPKSSEWTAAVGQHARTLGAAFTPLSWTGDKPATGLSAAARSARHALMADAARAAGVKVLCLAHTQDDIAEARWMRAHGSNVTAPAPWSPSPAWPQGRGVFLLRPLLSHSRASLRDELRAQGLCWIDDPSNENLASLRVRARHAAEPADEHIHEPEPAMTLAGMRAMLDDTWADFGQLVLRAEAFYALATPLRHKVLAAAAVCAGGGDRLPRGDSVSALVERLASGEVATLCGARVRQDDGFIRIAREAGDIGRTRPADLRLTAGIEAMWDGRFALTGGKSGGIRSSNTARAGLDPAQKAALMRLPAGLRGVLPVFDDKTPCFPGQPPQTDVNCVPWVLPRFLAACGCIAREAMIGTGLAETGGRGAIVGGTRSETANPSYMDGYRT